MYSVPQPENPEDTLWRYMDLPKLIYLLESERLYLARGDRLEDKHEGTAPSSQQQFEQNLHQELGVPEVGPIVSDLRRKQLQYTFVSCWHRNNSDSHAMWRIYCGAKHGVAITTTYGKLMESVDPDLHSMGLVTYGLEEPVPQNLIAPFMRKREAFRYENEVRIVTNIYGCLDIRDANGVPHPIREHLTIHVRLNELVTKIFVHPEADHLYFNVIKSVVSKYTPNLSARVEWSAMKAPGVF